MSLEFRQSPDINSLHQSAIDLSNDKTRYASSNIPATQAIDSALDLLSQGVADESGNPLDKWSTELHRLRLKRDLGLMMLKGIVSGEPIIKLLDAETSIDAALSMSSNMINILTDQLSDTDLSYLRAEHGANLTSRARLEAYSFAIDPRYCATSLALSLRMYGQAEEQLSQGNNTWYGASNALRAALATKVSPFRPTKDSPTVSEWLNLATDYAQSDPGSNGELGKKHAAIYKMILKAPGKVLGRFIIKRHP